MINACSMSIQVPFYTGHQSAFSSPLGSKSQNIAPGRRLTAEAELEQALFSEKVSSPFLREMELEVALLAEGYQSPFSSPDRGRLRALSTPSRKTELESIALGFDRSPPEMSSALDGSRVLSWIARPVLREMVSPYSIPDLYVMLKCVLTCQDDIEKYKINFKRALKPYTFTSEKNSLYQKKMIKIVGVDSRFVDSPKSRSMYAYNDNKPFSVSRDGMEVLCEIIREDVAIRYFMFIAKQERGLYYQLAGDHVGDEAVRVLAFGLPRDRFHLLKIGGSFGNEAAIDLLNQIPYLLKSGVQSPMVHIYGAGITEKTICDRCVFFAGLDSYRSQGNFER